MFLFIAVVVNLFVIGAGAASSSKKEMSKGDDDRLDIPCA